MIGVLALQGGVREHVQMLESLGARVLLVKNAAQLAQINGIVLPGGESSAMDRILRRFKMRDALIERLQEIPVLGTCAGLIMLAKGVINPAPGQETLKILDIDVRRNAFGPQRDSAVEQIDTIYGTVQAAFIRAPEIVRIGAGSANAHTQYQQYRNFAHAENPPASSESLLTSPENPDLRPIAYIDGRIVGVISPQAIGISFHPELTGDTTIHEEFLQLI
ncbi:pyridoxal 5'-phosphate synthase glutaminase subunit PdxT [Arcanobacterium hippocoleae]